MLVCEKVLEREEEREREREREGWTKLTTVVCDKIQKDTSKCVCVCVCVCERERERVQCDLEKGPLIFFGSISHRVKLK
jgi:hypothetical protein